MFPPECIRGRRQELRVQGTRSSHFLLVDVSEVGWSSEFEWNEAEEEEGMEEEVKEMEET